MNFNSFSSPWRTFPNCKFGDKCFFVHPNCKYDARCSKPECPFTHVSRRGSVAALPRPGIFSPPPVVQHTLHRPLVISLRCIWLTPICVFAAAQPAKAVKVCRFFPECKNVDCQFYHPKVRQKIWLCGGNNYSFRHFILKILFWNKSSEFCQQACRFAAMCKRASCTFYHPTTSVPPRHALKWTKAQTRWTEFDTFIKL